MRAGAAAPGRTVRDGRECAGAARLRHRAAEPDGDVRGGRGRAVKDLTQHYFAGVQGFDGNLLKGYRDDSRLPDGSSGQREYIKHPGAVAVVPLFDDGSILLERQFRYPHHKVFIEVPAGKREPRAPHLQTAERDTV